MKFDRIEQVVEWRLCMGCGACSSRCSQNAVDLVDVPEIGLRPKVNKEKCHQCGECVAVCPGIHLKHPVNSNGAIKSLSKSWGPILQVWEGFSTDEEIRYNGSSGGVATALALYALWEEDVSGIWQVGTDPDDPLENKPRLNATRQSLIQCTGSRYAPAATCETIDQVREFRKPCVFIGKPCEIAALDKLRSTDPTIDKKIAFTISIFCAGTPSLQGSIEIINQFGLRREDVRSIRYRGCGWPGKATITTKESGKVYELSYAHAWGDILSKHGQLRCRLCPDGTGEFADISCGDPWYRNIETGEKGYSLVLARTKRGAEIINRAVKADYVQLQRRSPSVLPQSQKSLIRRRRHLWGRFLVMKLMGIPVPRYERFHLFQNWLELPLKEKLRSLAGTFRRAIIRRWRKPLFFEIYCGQQNSGDRKWNT